MIFRKFWQNCVEKNLSYRFCPGIDRLVDAQQKLPIKHHTLYVLFYFRFYKWEKNAAFQYCSVNKCSKACLQWVHGYTRDLVKPYLWFNPPSPHQPPTYALRLLFSLIECQISRKLAKILKFSTKRQTTTFCVFPLRDISFQSYVQIIFANFDKLLWNKNEKYKYSFYPSLYYRFLISRTRWNFWLWVKKKFRT